MSLLMECSLRAAVLAAAVAAVIHGLRIRDARIRHAAWCGVLTTMLVLPGIVAWAPKATLAILPAAAAPVISLPVAADAPGTDPPAPAATVSAPPEHAPAAAREGPDWAVIVYLAIAGLLLARLLIGVLRAASLRKRSRQEDGFHSSTSCVCPLTVGWWRPVVVLPSCWTAWPRGELDAVLAHEREHARRRDPLVQAIAALNRCIFWFHPLAWWLEHRLSALSEEACDAAAIAAGHDPREYAEYLIRQARAVSRSGARIAVWGAAVGGGSLSRRVRVLLDSRPRRALTRRRAVAAAAALTCAISIATSCSIDRAERPAPGQPTMNELMHRRAEKNQKDMERQQAILNRAHSLAPEQAAQLFDGLKQNPQDMDACWTLIRYYEYRVDVNGLDALRLWYIEHQPMARCVGTIDPRADLAGYEKGKALWLAHLKQPGASAGMYQRAAAFLEGGDKPLAASVLEAGRKAYPGDQGWPAAFGRHYAEVLLGSAGSWSESNVVRRVGRDESSTRYAEQVREELAGSRDARTLAETAQWLIVWGRGHGARGTQWDQLALQLAHQYLARAESLEPNDRIVRAVNAQLTQIDTAMTVQQLMKRPAAEMAAAPAHERMILAMDQMLKASYRGNLDATQVNAGNLLALASQNPQDSLYGEALFDANMLLGKIAMRRGDRKAAVRDLLKAADAPASEAVRRGDFIMNLPRALVDWGERRAVIEFFRRVAAKSDRAAEFRRWAVELSKGINPDLTPTLGVAGCAHDPC